MKLRLLILAAIAASMMFAQAPPPRGDMAYQQISVMGGPEGHTFFFHVMGEEAAHGPTVAGKPVSATEQHHSLQVLADGTHIENTENNNFYRDEQGRTRVEHQGKAGVSHVMIHDPVAGYVAMLDPVNKVAHKTAHTAGQPAGAKATAEAPHGHVRAARFAGHTAVQASGSDTAMVVTQHAEMNLPAPVKEDLGTQTINGVVARGTRSTMTIPVGKMGNDRPIQVVNESWFSDDLQMVVKSVNNDPRFGETTYELTNIERSAPAASLFQIPSDYKVQEVVHDMPVGPHPPPSEQ
jgi:hypothetical protein